MFSELQHFAGLRQTGELDTDTENVIHLPRCGLPDMGNHDLELETDIQTSLNQQRRKKRYALHGSRWKTSTLTYRISKYPSKLSSFTTDRVIAKALKIWEDATNLKFVKQSSGKVHIEIRFERKRHGDEDDFDGRGGTLAHAFFPIYGGDVHFDDDEDWSDNFDRGTNLLMTASHELGHSLGLAHSNVRGSVMSPFYTPYKNGLKLHKDDIEGIQSLYGTKNGKKIKT